MISQVMKFYGGAVSYRDILDMPYKTFLMFFDYMLWQLRGESEDGRKINKRIERTDKIKAFGSAKVRRSEVQNVGDAMRGIKNSIKQ